MTQKSILVSDIERLKLQLIRMANECGGILTLDRKEASTLVENLQYIEEMVNVLELKISELEEIDNAVFLPDIDDSNVVPLFPQKPHSITGGAA